MGNSVSKGGQEGVTSSEVISSNNKELKQPNDVVRRSIEEQQEAHKMLDAEIEEKRAKRAEIGKTLLENMGKFKENQGTSAERQEHLNKVEELLERQIQRANAKPEIRKSPFNIEEWAKERVKFLKNAKNPERGRSR